MTSSQAAAGLRGLSDYSDPRVARRSSGSAKMLETILSLRGDESSSAPKEMLEVPPGGRSTLRNNK
ncbi:hypothetical protein EYF80_020474 [Liparis tanakae]|uniref:Uncharacterized protein n=1 Tax=Liparis tanakae TaxID=230148 RepID=A0A4Z2HWH3_9TELE|nr:hypothetical protein EYF80_020474 [Liparis tanakae]